ncbi:hypothetical protein TCON_1083 [Astathelohania contejeani]|uniref:Uncharacterized protein n=1 Tax=Astathelohania contejeani TaxID=164912 RepID=A0ABQ7HZY4_9MICR|nr:hypothetical protein TCON_1083 [Thelohania contejeani]
MSQFSELVKDVYSSNITPLRFIIIYSEIYDIQKDNPRKIFLDQIPYYSSFEADFIDDLFKRVNVKKLRDVIKYFIDEVENAIISMTKKEYYDADFYDLCICVYCKAVGLLVDECEGFLLSDINLYDPASLDIFINCIRVLYIFTDLKIDLYDFFVDYVWGDCEFDDTLKIFERLGIVEHTIKRINIERCSYFRDNKLLHRRVNVDKYLLGEQRILEYNTLLLVRRLVKKLRFKIKVKNTEEFYLRIMNFISEIVVRGLIDDPKMIDDLKKYACELLNM